MASAANDQYFTRDELFHFVGRSLNSDDDKYKLLVDKIIRRGVLSHPPHDGQSHAMTITNRLTENGTSGKYEWKGDLVAERYADDPSIHVFPNIVCFADIPFEMLGLHTEKYSRFGLSFSKRQVAEFGGRPVMYFPYWREDWRGIQGKLALRGVERILREIFEDQLELPDNVRRDFILRLAAYLKPFDLDLAIAEPDSPNNYYAEREWRMLGYFSFIPADIIRVVVPERYVARLQSDLPSLEGRISALT